MAVTYLKEDYKGEKGQMPWERFLWPGALVLVAAMIFVYAMFGPQRPAPQTATPAPAAPAAPPIINVYPPAPLGQRTGVSCAGKLRGVPFPCNGSRTGYCICPTL